MSLFGRSEKREINRLRMRNKELNESLTAERLIRSTIDRLLHDEREKNRQLMEKVRAYDDQMIDAGKLRQMLRFKENMLQDDKELIEEMRGTIDELRERLEAERNRLAEE